MGDRKRAYGDDDGQRFPKRDRRNDKVIKVLCPYYSAGAIIGKGGEAIKEIKNETGANIQVSKNDVRFPNTDERVITISGQLEPMQKVVAFVQDKIRSDKIPPHVKNINTSENDARKAMCKIVVPDTSVGRIIGKGGANIKRLQEEYNVRIGTMKKEDAIDGLHERIISVESDNQENVDGCVAEMVKEVYEDERAHMDYNVDYEAFGSSKGRGYGGGDKGGYGDQSSQSRGYGGRDSSYGGRDAGFASRDSGYVAKDTGFAGRDSGYGARDTGYGARDSGYAARDSGYSAPYAGGYESEKSYGSGGGYSDRGSYGGSRGGGYGSDRDRSYNSTGGHGQSDTYPATNRQNEPRGNSYGRVGSHGPPEGRPRNY